MKPLPPAVEAYRRTPEFTEESIPDGLRKPHRTKPGVWGRIVVREGQLLYRTLQPASGELTLGADNPGVIEPEVEHEVEPLGRARFFVEFYR